MLANLKKITEFTGFPKANYIGHSQGTTQLIAALSNKNSHPRLEIEKRLHNVHLLAPVILANTIYFLDDRSNFLMIPLFNLLMKFNIMGLKGTDLQPNSLKMMIVKQLARYCPNSLRSMTFTIVDACIKKNDKNPQLLVDYWRTNATGISLRSINHFLQLRNTTTKHQLRKYDFG